MPEWQDLSEFERISASSLNPRQGSVYTVPSITSNSIYAYSTSNTSTQLTPDLSGMKEATMAKNTKSFRIVKANGDVEEFTADNVTVSGGRIVFTEYDQSTGENRVVKSYRDQTIDEYSEYKADEAPVEGKQVYRITFTDGTTKDVRADRVLHDNGHEGKGGRYSLATTLNDSSRASRTEFVVPTEEVKHIERVTDEATKPVADANA